VVGGDGVTDGPTEAGGADEPPAIPPPMMEFPADEPPAFSSPRVEFPAAPPPAFSSPMMEFPAAGPPAFSSPRVEFPGATPVIAAPDVRRKNRADTRWVVYSAIAGVVVLVVIGAVAVFSTGGHGDSSRPPTSAAPLPNTGPFTGTFTADFGPETDVVGKPYDGAAPSSETWGTRSACRSTPCVATASRRSGTTLSLTTLVFDQVGEYWVAVVTASATCRNMPDEQFDMMTLQPRPDGRLVGDYVMESSQGCFTKRTVTFTRTGDVDVASLPDPTNQAPRVVSPAEALHGRYHAHYVYASGPRFDFDYGAQTYCLRTGDRCMSFFQSPAGLQALVFEAGTWTRTQEYDTPCPAGGTTHIKINAQYPLPQPPQNPITRLTGHGHQEESGSSCVTSDFDSSYVRTGD
jgi:hypothetical protein